MAQVSYAQAVSAGVRLIARKPWVLLAWAAVYLVLAVLPLTLIMSKVIPDVIATYREAAHAISHGARPDPAKALALKSELMILRPLILVIELVAYTLLTGAAFRAVLEPAASRWGYLRLSRQELSLGLTMTVFLLVFAVLIFTLLAILSVAAAVGVASAHAGHSPGPMAYPLLKLIQLACGVAILWVMLRLSLALPMSFAQGRFVFYEAWSLTRREGPRLFLVGLTLFVVLYASNYGAALALRWVAMGGLPNIVALRAAAGVAGAILGMGLFAILAAPFAELYRQLTSDRPA